MMGFKRDSTGQTSNWDIYWADVRMTKEKMPMMKPYQRINMIPGMNILGQKNLLPLNLDKMAKYYENEYKFFPKTWVLPQDKEVVKSLFTKKKDKTFIVKPLNSCQGNGIFLAKNWK